MNNRIPESTRIRICQRCIDALESGYCLTRRDLSATAVEEGLKSGSIGSGELEADLDRLFYRQNGVQIKVLKKSGVRIFMDPRLNVMDTDLNEVQTEIQSRLKRVPPS
jgi:hypothetical protein